MKPSGMECACICIMDYSLPLSAFLEYQLADFIVPQDVLLSDDVTYLFVLSSVVSKHLLLALSVLCFFVELT